MRKFVLPVMIALLAGAVGCSSRAVDDSAITAKVKAKLAADSQTSAIKIGVETKNGTVTLSGTVPTTTEKDEADKVAKNTEGVKRVVNDITVNPDSLGANQGRASLATEVRSARQNLAISNRSSRSHDSYKPLETTSRLSQ